MEVKKGDIILIRTRAVMGRIIQFGMNVERWRWLSFKPFWKKVSNHAAICIEDGIIAEAKAEGIVKHSFESAYGNAENINIKIYRPPLSDSEKDRLKTVALSYYGTKYQFINFIQYIPKILFGIWLGRTHAQATDRLYCTEFVGLVLNKVSNGNLFKKYWRTSPSGVQSWCEREAELITEIEK